MKKQAAMEAKVSDIFFLLDNICKKFIGCVPGMVSK